MTGTELANSLSAIIYSKLIRYNDRIPLEDLAELAIKLADGVEEVFVVIPKRRVG